MQIISRVKIKVLRPDEMPKGLDEVLIHTYIKTGIKNAYRMRWRITENMPDIETIIEQVIKPGLEGMKKQFKQDYITKSGLTVEQALAIDRKGLERRAERYIEALEKLPDIKELIDELKYKSQWYVKKMFERVIPFKGYKDMVHGVGQLAARWLMGDATVKDLIPYSMDNLHQPVDIRKPEMTGRFRMKLMNKIISHGKNIVKTAYHPTSFQQANEAMNDVVRQHARDDLAVDINFVKEYGDLWLVIEVAQK